MVLLISSKLHILILDIKLYNKIMPIMIITKLGILSKITHLVATKFQYIPK
jgi:hypothetical protein